MNDPHAFFAVGNDRDFIAFNADQPLTDEAIEPADLELIMLTGDIAEKLRSAAWSSNCNWCFVIRESDILLINAATKEGVLCRKKSYRFIEAFLDAPHSHSRKRGKSKDAGR